MRFLNKKIIVGSVYRPNTPVFNLSSTDQFNQFCEILTNINFELQQLNSDLYLMGDFNLDVLKYQNCNLSKTYIDLLFSLGLLQVVTKPTRCKPNSATLIDHVCTSSQSQSISTYIIVSHISDHFPIIVKLSDVKTASAPKFIEYRDFSHANSINFTTALCALDWNDVLVSDNAQTAYNLFSDSFLNLFNLFFPIKKLKFNRNVHNIEKCMTPGLLVSRKNKIMLGKNFSKNPNDVNSTCYKNYRNVYNRTVKAAKKLFYDSQFKLNQANIKKTWELMFEVIKKTKSKTNDISSILADNVSFSDPKMIAEKFNEFFTGVAQKIADKIPPASMPDNFFNTPPNQPIFDFESTPVTSSEIVDVIKELKVKKTLDCNGLSTLLLSKHALTLSTPLKHVISLSLNTGIVPVQLKIAKVIPIFKSGDKQQLDNYRPISLLNVFSKIYERVVYNRLVTFLNVNHLLSPYQFGFRKGHSTVHPLTLFMNNVSESLNNKKTFYCYFLRP
jgi:hypothetical protein